LIFNLESRIKDYGGEREPVLKWMLCSFGVAVMLWTGLALSQEKSAFTADKHKERDIACTGCHDSAQPKEAASAASCLKCHKSMEAVAEKTKGFTPNPHKNHVTDSQDVECTQCHQGHKADTPMCSQCHGEMKFEKQAEEAK
jgi:fumarate reductase flavoprotein subunit